MNAPMNRRPALASFLMAATVTASLLPPAHIHLAADHDDDHHHGTAIEHAHWSPHAGGSRVALDDDDGQAIFVEHPALVQISHAAGANPPADLIAILTTVDPPAFVRSAQRLAGNAPRDGPSRAATPLRAPPAFATL